MKGWLLVGTAVGAGVLLGVATGRIAPPAGDRTVDRNEPAGLLLRFLDGVAAFGKARGWGPTGATVVTESK